MSLPSMKLGTVMKAVPLTILFGSVAAYAAVPIAESLDAQDSMVWSAAATTAGGFQATTLAGAAGFDPDATTCSYPETTDIRQITLVDTAGDDSQTNADAIAAAIAQAKSDLALPGWNTTIVLKIPAGTWEIGGSATDAINLDGVNDGVSSTAWLVISGDTMQNTTLNFTNYQQQALKGNNVYRLHICNLHLTRADETVSQGTILGFLPSATWSDSTAPWGDETLTNVGSLDTSGTQAQTMVVDLDAGFPDLNAIYDTGFFDCQGRYLRKYKYAGTNPVIRLDSNPIEPWIMRDQISGTGTSLDGKWAVRFGRPSPGTNNAIFVTPPAGTYSVGDQIAIKAKKTRDAMFFGIGSDIVVENVRLTRETRMVFRGGSVAGATMDNVRLTNVAIERMPAIGGKIPFIASAEGGPQFFGLILPATPPPPPPPPPPLCPAGSGTPTDSTPMHSAVIENSDFTATGDDAVGLFNVDGFSMTSSNIADALGRGVTFANSATTPCIHAVIQHDPIYTDQSPSFAWGCVTDSTAPSAVTSLIPDTSTAGRIRLTWSSSNPADWDGFQIMRHISGDTDPTHDYPVVIGLRANAFNDTTVQSGVTYVYSVYSFDKSRNMSTAATATATAP